MGVPPATVAGPSRSGFGSDRRRQSLRVIRKLLRSVAASGDPGGLAPPVNRVRRLPAGCLLPLPAAPRQRGAAEKLRGWAGFF